MLQVILDLDHAKEMQQKWNSVKTTWIMVHQRKRMSQSGFIGSFDLIQAISDQGNGVKIE